MRFIPLIVTFFVLLGISLSSLSIAIYVDFFSTNPPPAPKPNEPSKTALLYLLSIIAGTVSVILAVAFTDDKTLE